MNSRLKCKGISKFAIVLLTLVMIIASLPALAFAEEDDLQVHVVIKNDIYTLSEGAEWDGTLVDEWVTIDDKSTMLSCIESALSKNNFTANVASNGYISSINGLSELDGGSDSGWMIMQNDWFIDAASSEFSVANGKLHSTDEIIVAYSLDRGVDLGGDFNNNAKTLANLTFNYGTLSPEFSSDVKVYTLTIDSSVNKVQATPTATTKNFMVKTYLGTQADGTEYARKAQIPVSNGSVITIVCGDPSWPTMNQASSVPKETYTVNIVVNAPVNNAPNVKAGAPTTAQAEAGKKFTLDLSTIFEDKDGDSLTYTVSVDGADAVAANKDYEFTPDKEGSVILKFTANDGKATAEHTVTLTADKANTPPYVKATAATTATVSLKYAYNPTVSSFFGDADGDKLTYTVSVNGADPVAINNIYRYQTTELGVMTFKFTASDGKASVSHTVTVTVVNDAPTVQAKAATTGVNKLGEEYSLDLSTIFTDKNKDTLTYKVSVDGAEYVATESPYKITPAKAGDTVLKFIANDGLESSPEHTFTLSTFDSGIVKINTTPSDATVRVYEGTDELTPSDQGEYKVNIGYATYTYEVIKEGYAGKSAEIKTSGNITVELQKLGESTFTSVDAYWPIFRGNDSNMAIVDTKLPITANSTKLAWNKKFGTGWSDAPSVQIIADNSLVVMCNTKIYKLSLDDGKILAQGDMTTTPNWGYTAPIYAEGLIICPLSNGTIQAFNAKTLESVWVYQDMLKGQSITPIAYSDGYIYTGFYTGTTNGNFVCISLADEDPASTNETKLATWKVTNKGGYYWSGAGVVGDYVVFGSEQDAEKNGHLFVVNKYTGNIVEKVAIPNNIRSTIAYDSSTSKIYFTTQGSRLYSANIDKSTGKLSNIRYTDIANASVSTPIVYKGRIYVYTDAKFFVVDDSTMDVIFSVSGTGIAKASPILSTAYESDGYLCFYNTYNSSPGGIRMVKVKTDAKSADDAEVIDIYNADGFKQYCICSLICSEDGTIYYKNDSLNVLAVEKINTPPNVKEGASTSATIDLNDKFTLDLSAIFEDKDNDKLTYTVSVDGKEAVNAPKNYELTPDKSGSIELKFTASDGKASAEHKITLKVNTSPNVKDNAAKNGEVDQYSTFTLDLSTIFEDKDNDKLTYTVSVDGADAVETTKNYKITPNKAGSINLKFVASDGRKSVEHKFTLVVNKVYIITSGNDSTWVINSTKDIVITCDGPFSEFVGLMIDGEMLEEDKYTVEEGSTVVTLKPEYLSSLSVGEHDIRFVYESQNVDGVFTIKDLSTPKTGDNIDNLILLGIAMSVGAIGIYSINKRRKHN